MPGPRPTPASLRRFTDPAARVTPVDYSAVPGRASGSESEQSAQGGQGAQSAQGAQGREARRPAASKPRTPITVELVPPPAPAPADAVVTLNPSDPRPYTRPLQVHEEEIRTVSGASFRSITHDAIVLTVADPEDTWTSDNGTSDHYLRGEWAVQVRRGDNHVIGAFPRRYALAVRPETAELGGDETGAGGASNRRKRGTRHPGDVRALKKRLESHGFVVTTSGATHGKVTHPDFPGLFTPWASTPSDRRHPQLVTAQVKRVFGIDIREG